MTKIGQKVVSMASGRGRLSTIGLPKWHHWIGKSVLKDSSRESLNIEGLKLEPYSDEHIKPP
jgi:hypothetical protein